MKKIAFYDADLIMRQNYNRYILEYDFYKNSDMIELYKWKETIFFYDRPHSYIMIANVGNRDINLDEIVEKCKGIAEQRELLININCNVFCNLLSDKINIKKVSDENSYIFTDTNALNKIKTLRDINNIIELNESNAHLIEGCCNETIKYRPSLSRLFEHFIINKKGKIFAYVTDDKINGYLSCLPILKNVYDLDYIYVEKDSRNNGIGKSLALFYANYMHSNIKTAYWSNAANIQSEKVAQFAGFSLSCRHISFSICKDK